MPKLFPIQESFAAGELSPRMLARTTTKGYKEGAQKLENMIPWAQGPAKRRPGLGFAFEAPDDTQQARLIPFPIDFDTYFLLLFVESKLYVLNQVGNPIAPELVLNSDFHLGALNWISNPGAGATISFSPVSCTLVSSPARLAHIQQDVTGLVIGETYRFLAIQLAPLDAMEIRVGTTQGGAEVGAVTNVAQLTSIDFVATATSHWIQCESLTNGASLVLTSVSVQLQGAPASVPTPFVASELGLLQTEIDPAGQVMYITSGTQPVQEITYDGVNWTFAPTTFTDPPAEWTAGNYPRALTFFQGRLWFAANFTHPSTFWASKSGLYTDFTLGQLADDSLAYTIAKRGAIRWILGAKNLLIGTEDQEYVVSATAGSQDPITPTDINLEPQSAYGSSAYQPVLLGNIVLYVSGDGRKLYSMGYRFEESGWVSTDLTLPSENLTEQRIVAYSYAQRPESIVWAIKGDSTLIGCSYERGNNIVGWHRHPSQVEFRSICTVKYLGLDILWSAWRIQRDGLSYIQVGAIGDISGEIAFQDAFKTVTLAAPGTVFAGYEHLAGFEVAVLADNAVHPNVIVDAGGVITTQLEVIRVIAGLATKATLKSMPFEPGVTPQGTMTAFKRFNKAFVRLLNSSKPLINGIRPPDRTPASPMNLREPPVTGSYHSVTLGYNLSEVITIEEDLPLNLVVAGLFGEMEADVL